VRLHHYKSAISPRQFIANALLLVPQVAMLCRLAFLESERRTPLLETSGLHRVIVFRNRLPMMHRYGWTGPRNSNATAFAWYCWQRGYNEAPQLQRVSWRPTPGQEGPVGAMTSLPEFRDGPGMVGSPIGGR